MQLFNEYVRSTRRQFFTGGANLMGMAAMGSLLGRDLFAQESAFMLGPHFAPKAKQVIHLHMVGGPAQMDLFERTDHSNKGITEATRQTVLEAGLTG